MFFYLRKIFKLNFIQKFLSWVIYAYLKFVYITTRWQYVGEDILRQTQENGSGGVIAFYHGQLAMMPFAWNVNAPFHMLLSDHPDGRFIARIVKHHGIDAVYGSSTRGGTKALISLVKLLKNKQFIGITPDGPKGPNQHISPGILHLCKLFSAPIIPCTYALKYYKRLNSWDKFMVPFPFNKGVIYVSAARAYPELFNNTSLEHAQQTLQTTMLEIQEKAQDMANTMS